MIAVVCECELGRFSLGLVFVLTVAALGSVSD